MNEVAKHLTPFIHDDSIPCPYPTCKAAELVLPGVMAFKNHTATVHKISLRAWAPPLDTPCRLSIVTRNVDLSTYFLYGVLVAILCVCIPIIT